MMDEIICGNHIDVMSNMRDESVDLTVTSPPYEGMRDYDGYVFECEPLAIDLLRITKVGGVCVWIVADQTVNHAMSGESFRQALTFQSVGWNIHHTMIYKKQPRQVGTPAGAYFNDFEYMFVFSRGKPKTYDAICDAELKHNETRHHSRRADGSVRKRTIPERAETHRKRGRIWQYHTGGWRARHRLEGIL